MPILDVDYARQAYKRASDHLNGIASDFEQMVDQLDKKANRTPAEMADRRMWVEKAQLLRGQAKQILELE